jgi:hypothetical protein
MRREDVRRYLAGHRAADVRLRREALRRLRSLAVEEARAEYDALCQVWEASQAFGDRAALDRRAIADRIALRRRLDRRR